MSLEDDEKQVPATSDATEPQTTPPKSQQSQQKSDDEITPDRYRGLQRIVAKRDDEIAKLKEAVEKMSEALEEQKLQANSSASEKEKLAKQLEENTKALVAAQAEQAKAAKKLTQQSIVLKEFPDLAPLVDYIPVTEDDVAFRTAAQGFKAALENYIAAGVKQKLSGASPKADAQSQAMIPDGEEERLWSIIERTAGVAGKETEYREANDKLQALLMQKQS